MSSKSRNGVSSYVKLLLLRELDKKEIHQKFSYK